MILSYSSYFGLIQFFKFELINVLCVFVCYHYREELFRQESIHNSSQLLLQEMYFVELCLSSKGYHFHSRNQGSIEYLSIKIQVSYLGIGCWLKILIELLHNSIIPR